MYQHFCNQCGDIKPANAFNRDRTRGSGRQKRCKDCLQAYRDTHKEEKRLYDENYRAAKRWNRITAAVIKCNQALNVTESSGNGADAER